MIEPARSRVVEIYEGTQITHRVDPVVIKEKMTRYASVMKALSGTKLTRKIEREARDDLKLESRLRDELYRRVRRNTRVEVIGQGLVRISYTGRTPYDTYMILSKLTQDFVENELRCEKQAAEQALELAKADLGFAQDRLEALEGRRVSFLKEHPKAAEPGLRGTLRDLSEVKTELAEMIRKREANQKKLDYVREQVRKLPEEEPGASELHAKLKEREIGITIDLKGQNEEIRHLRGCERQVEGEAVALREPARQLRRLEADREEAASCYQAALKRYRRVKRAYDSAMMGLASYEIVSWARVPREPESP
ncbi:MAG: hypothetical protein R6V58_03300 [Planctomycetota bacterium]